MDRFVHDFLVLFVVDEFLAVDFVPEIFIRHVLVAAHAQTCPFHLLAHLLRKRSGQIPVGTNRHQLLAVFGHDPATGRDQGLGSAGSGQRSCQGSFHPLPFPDPP